MAEELFELPRPDWYDSEGRIYKDALIENFNAIEKKILYLQEHLTVKVEEPDWNEIHVPNITNIDEAQDNDVINLKTFVDMLNIKNFPLKCEFNGTLCVRLTYFNNSYQLVTIQNKKVSNLSANMPLVYLNPNSRSLYAASTKHDSDILVGAYANGTVYAVNDVMRMCDIDLLSILSRMPVEAGEVKEGWRNSQGRLWHAVRQDGYAGWTDVNLHRAHGGIKLLPVDIGREGGKIREN